MGICAIYPGLKWTIIKGARYISDYKNLLPEFVEWYNHDRPHQRLFYKTPSEVLDLQSNDVLNEKMLKHHFIIGKKCERLSYFNTIMV